MTEYQTESDNSYNKIYYEKNKNKCLLYSKEYYERHKENEEFKKKISVQKKEYYKLKKENIIKNKLLEIKEKYNLNDEEYKLLELIKEDIFK